MEKDKGKDKLFWEYREYLRAELRRSEHTVVAYMHDLESFSEWLRIQTGVGVLEMRWDMVASNDIRSWLAYVSGRGIGARSLRRKAQSLRAFFKWLLKRGIISSNPSSELILAKIGKPLPELIDSNDLEQELRAGYLALEPVLRVEGLKSDSRDIESFRNLLIVEMFYSLGLRRSELSGLDDGDVGVDTLRVFGKGRKERLLPLPGELSRRLSRWQKLRGGSCGALFTHKSERINPNKVYRIVRDLTSGMRGGRKSPHTLRHTFATSMVEGGADLNSVKQMLGHASLATTEVYTHLSFMQVKDAYCKAHPRARDKEEKK